MHPWSSGLIVTARSREIKPTLLLDAAAREGLLLGFACRTAIIATASLSRSGEVVKVTPSSSEESLISAKWAAGFGAGFPGAPGLDPGNLHSGSPAQCPMTPHLKHLLFDFSSVSFRLLWSIVRLDFTIFPFPFPLGFPKDFPLPPAFPIAVKAASCSWMASPACRSSSAPSSSSKLFNATASYSSTSSK